jgi:hypothetical protein
MSEWMKEKCGGPTSFTWAKWSLHVTFNGSWMENWMEGQIEKES